MLRRRRALAAALASVLAVALGACNEDNRRRTVSPATGNEQVTIALTGLEYRPATTTIRPGQSVAWKWDGTLVHDVAFDDGLTSPKQTSGTWERSFPDPGNYDYVCTLHPQMTGKVLVAPG